MLSRTINPITKKLIQVQYGQLVNIDNILKISRLKINKIFKDEEFKIKNIYLHNIISEWINLQENHDETFFRTLNKLIRKTKVDITEEEKHDLFLLEERAFSKDRHIKIIEVNYPLTPKEKVGVKFTNAKLYTRMGAKYNPVFTNEDDLLISNRRIIFPNNDITYKFSSISEYWYKDRGFEFKFDGARYVVRIHDQETLNNTIENLINKKVKNAIKKRRDNK